MQNRKERELQKIDKYNNTVRIVKQAGYTVFCSLKAGSNSIFSFTDRSGNKSSYGWDNESSVYEYVYKTFLEPDLLNS